MAGGPARCCRAAIGAHLQRQLIVYLDIGDPQRNQGVLTVGAHFDGSVVRGGELHNQDFTIRQTTSEFTFEAAGGPAEVASRTAEQQRAGQEQHREDPGPSQHPAEARR